MRFFRRIFLPLFFVTGCYYSQSNASLKIDSLRKELSKGAPDTNRVNQFFRLADLFLNLNPDSAISIGTQALVLADKLNWEPGRVRLLHQLGWYHYSISNDSIALQYYLSALKQAELAEKTAPEKCSENLNGKGCYTKVYYYGRRAAALSNIALVYDSKSEYARALELLFTALKMSEKIGHKKYQAIQCRNISRVYGKQGNFLKALSFGLKALKLDEESGDEGSIAAAYSAVALVYMSLDDYGKSREYYGKALEMYKRTGNAFRIASTLGNLGIVAEHLGQLEKAGEYYSASLQKSEALGDKNGMARQLGNIAILYNKQKQYEKSLEFHQRALKINEDNQNKHGIANNLSNIASVYCNKKNYKLALSYSLQALKIIKEIGAADLERSEEYQLSEIYGYTGDHKNAFEHYKRSVRLNDSIHTQENKKELVRKEMNYSFEKKEAETKALQDKKDALAAEDLRQQKMIIMFVGSCLLLVVIFAIVILRSFVQKKKANLLLAEKNRQIELQKEMVEAKQKEILDSIHYAKRIQQALLTPESLVRKNLSRLNK
jgi:tetratricopeptide (TPR) repeat protein